MPVDLLHHYRHVTNHIIPGPQSLSYFIPLLLLPTALLIPRHILPRWLSIAFFMPTITLASLSAWTAMRGVDVISVDVVLSSLYLLVLNDPWKDFQYIPSSSSHGDVSNSSPRRSIKGDARRSSTRTTKSGRTTKPKTLAISNQHYPESFAQRLSWVLNLLTSIRFNNWKINLPSHDTHQPPSPAFPTRKALFLQALLSLTRGYLILDLTSAYTHSDPYFTNPHIPISSPLPTTITTLFPLPPQFLRAMILSAQAWALISQIFYAPALLPLALNACSLIPDSWSPHTWAPYFGSPLDVLAHGVRGFWGRYWHQMMRHSTSAPGYAVADLLGLSKGGLLRYAVITVVAFGLSGVVHMGLVPPEPLGATVSVDLLRVYVAGFFWVQPVALMVEAVVERVWMRGKKVEGPATIWRRVVIAIWVGCWFTLYVPLLGEAGRQLGYWRHWLVPFSLWKWARGEADFVTWSFLRN
ncbi:hypothetical protein BDY17DRAFT_300829 [Neohortaea acidophila]|uniref:Wax synthase domain-containing protein n=1 Tax=Neohortaea acidophila TaxID=245834 RepID=A0A6A6PNB5_9PEZI|nr:uncharacterized protein BDY17DRAFT_300829 [Neohortaea acidophila]KAF2481181.1 hypothetical protein BDY17DRAFT_300829 [Neohortaea acidophila]